MDMSMLFNRVLNEITMKDDIFNTYQYANVYNGNRILSLIRKKLEIYLDMITCIIVSALKVASSYNVSPSVKSQRICYNCDCNNACTDNRIMYFTNHESENTIFSPVFNNGIMFCHQCISNHQTCMQLIRNIVSYPMLLSIVGYFEKDTMFHTNHVFDEICKLPLDHIGNAFLHKRTLRFI